MGERSTLPLLPLHDVVLLPGGFLRVHIPGQTPLVSHLLAQEAGELVVAAVPVLGGHDQPDESEADAAVRAHDVGVAARVSQIVRRPKTGSWTMLLEGLHRIRVLTPPPADPQGGIRSVTVHDLDSAAAHAADPSIGRVESAAFDRLLASTRELLLIAGRGNKAAGRSAAAGKGAEGGGAAAAASRAEGMLSAQGAARAADVVGSLVARTPRDRLRVLRACDASERITLVQGMLDAMLPKATRQGQTMRAGEPRSQAIVPHGKPRGDAPSAPAPPATGATGGVAGGEGASPPASAPSAEDALSDPEDELDDAPDSREEARTLLRRVKAADPPPEVMAAARREARRLARGGDGHPGAAASVAYLEALAEVPWGPPPPEVAESADDRELGALEGGEGEQGEGGRSGRPRAGARTAPVSLSRVRSTLDARHAGLPDVKARLVEHVAVSRLRGPGAPAPVLLLVGPPGVGKTSLAASAAAALGRPFQRISLGGVRDEAEIRGHRRTYVGALPGRVVSALRRAGRSDAVLLLDEVDKLGRDARGDPASALLEVLDPEQNGAFTDHYLALPLDLSRVIFVATANRLGDVPEPLRDRMEVVQLPGYTASEKLEIARTHLVPRALDRHGLSPEDLTFPDDALRALVDRYTREAGVRDLARRVAAVCRAVAVRIVEESEGGGALPDADAGAARTPPGGERSPPVAGDDAAGPGPGRPALAAGPGPGRPALAALRASSELGAARARLADPGPRRPPRFLTAGAAGLLLPVDAYPRPPSRGVLAAARLLAADAERAPGADPGPRAPRACTAGWRDWLPFGIGGGASAGADSAARQGGAEDDDRRNGDREARAALDRAARALLLRAAREDAGAGAGGRADDEDRAAAWAAAAGRPAGPKSATRPRRGAAAAAAAAAAAGASPALSSLVPRRRLGPVVVTPELLEAILKAPPYEPHDATERVSGPGAAAGLVWTPVGGAVLYCEALAVSAGVPGRAGQLTLTGQLGEVLEESARIALSWVRANPPSEEVFGEPSAPERGEPGASAADADAAARRRRPSLSWDVHVHLPAGATPKDGPSAGVTLATALLSLFSGRQVRPDVAMTGELTLRGLVLPVGGVKEKLLAAHAAGVKRVVLPQRNLRDALLELPQDVLADLELIGCARMEEVVQAAFIDPPALSRAAQGRL